mmetsp:Transcript_1549/g.2048  ORF Transcript_1549/g.2048 Transcript_1549/m.2048 type:complete len:202 (-) Transcript_1549:15-620(-)
MDHLLFDYIIPSFCATEHKRLMQCYTFQDTRKRYNPNPTSIASEADIHKFLDPIEFPIVLLTGKVNDILVLVLDGQVSVEQVKLMKVNEMDISEEIQQLEASKWKTFHKNDFTILVGDNIILETVKDSWRFDFFFHIDLKIDNEADSVNTPKFKLGGKKRRSETELTLFDIPASGDAVCDNKKHKVEDEGVRFLKETIHLS